MILYSRFISSPASSKKMHHTVHLPQNTGAPLSENEASSTVKSKYFIERFLLLTDLMSYFQIWPLVSYNYLIYQGYFMSNLGSVCAWELWMISSFYKVSSWVKSGMHNIFPFQFIQDKWQKREKSSSKHDLTQMILTEWISPEQSELDIRVLGVAGRQVRELALPTKNSNHKKTGPNPSIHLI